MGYFETFVPTGGWIQFHRPRVHTVCPLRFHYLLSQMHERAGSSHEPGGTPRHARGLFCPAIPDSRPRGRSTSNQSPCDCCRYRWGMHAQRATYGSKCFRAARRHFKLSETRNGAIRSMGPFLHSIPAGAFGATLVPLLIWLWSDAKSRKRSDANSQKLAVLGLFGATAMAVTCHSSTVLSCYVAGIFGLCMWPVRKHMRVIRYGLLLTVIGLHLIMKGPVWSLLEHIDLTGSSENFHRFALVDTLITHFNEWWLLGTSNNGSWGWEMADTSNEYVYYGVDGGLLTLGLFIALISRCLGRLGTKRKIAAGNRSEEWFLWCLGSAMFAHLVVFVGIDYFDQMLFAWFTLLAIISTSISPAKVNSRAGRTINSNRDSQHASREFDEVLQACSVAPR